MGFFKPADDETEAGAATSDEDAAADARRDGGDLASSAEGEGSGALEDLGVDLDTGLTADDGSAAGA